MSPPRQERAEPKTALYNTLFFLAAHSWIQFLDSYCQPRKQARRSPINAVTLLTHLHRYAQEQADAIAFRFLLDGETQEATLTYGELDRQARAVAARLLAMGTPGQHVLLLYPPGLDYIVSIFGCWYASMVAIPAYPPRHNRHMARLQAAVADSEAALALTTSEAYARITSQYEHESALQSLRWIVTDVPDTVDTARQAPQLHHDTLALIQYTSGSTAIPKGVMLSHRNLVQNLTAMATMQTTEPMTTAVTWLPPYHDMGLIGMLLLPIYIGGEAIVMSPWSFLQRPVRWLQAITRYGGQFSGAPNFAYELCVHRITPAQKHGLDLSSWKAAFNGAERIRPATLEGFVEAFAACGFQRTALSPCYGLAEATLCVTCTLPTSPPRVAPYERTQQLASCGRVVPQHQIRIVNPETCQPAAAGQVGEIWVAGPSVAQGYWRQPEQTQQVFQARIVGEETGPWLRTGDLGFLQDNELFVTGRLKDLIIIDGKNYYPEDIEYTVQQAHPALLPDCGAAFTIDVDGHERLVVVQEVRRTRDLDTDAVLAAIRAAVAHDHHVQLYVLLLLRSGQLPKTSSGKIQRHLCRAEFQRQRFAPLASDLLSLHESPEVQATATTSPLHQHIAAAMSDVLALEAVDMHENFFQLGGQSLLATQLASRLRETLDIDVPLRLIFEAPTAAELARRLAGELSDNRMAPVIRPIARDGTLPLTFAQKRMWFLHLIEPDSAAYNIGGALMMTGPLVYHALQRALQDLIQRHELLRSNYRNVDGQPLQIIRPELPLELAVVDLTASDDPEAAALADAEQMLARPFDLADAPLIRFSLSKVAPERHILAIALHHIVADAWSVSILLHEALQLYTAYVTAYVAEQPSPLPPLALQYIDYAHWQCQWLQGPTLRRQLDYWTQQLADVPACIPLPTDRPRTAKRSTRGALHSLDLPESLLQALQRLSRQHNLTLFMTLLTAFKVLLYRYSHQTDIAVGVPIANRNWLAAETLVGTLVNTLVMRTHLEGEADFATCLQRVKHTALAAYDNQDLPFEQLIEALQPERTIHHAPLFQVMFDYQHVAIPASPLADLKLEPLVLCRGAAQFDLCLCILDTGTTHIASMEYSTELFDASTITRMMAHFVSLLEAITATTAQPISALPLLSATERQKILREWNATTTSAPLTATVCAAFERQAAATPQALAVLDHHQRLTYAQLNAKANQLGHYIRASGVGPEVLVGLCLDRSCDLIVALLGILKAGGAYVPLDPANPPDRIASILEDTQPRIVVTQRPFLARLSLPSDTAIIALDHDWPAIAQYPRDNLRPQATPGDLAYVIFTSGSTGRPKGVGISHRALMNFLSAMARHPGLHADDYLLAVTTVAFDIAALELFLPLIVGARVDIVPGDITSDGEQLRMKLDTTPCTVMQATPSTWRLLLAAGWQGKHDLTIFCGGETLPRELAEQLLRRSAAVWNLYGPTEATIWATTHRVVSGGGLVPIGTPIANIQTYILDQRLEPVPIGVAGELYIGGEGVARGYLHRPDLTADRFIPDPFSSIPGARLYRTGDIARYHADGTIEWLERRDQQVKMRGYRIELGEIEAALASYPQIQQVVVCLAETQPDIPHLVAYYVSRDQQPIETTLLRQFLRRTLPAYMVPIHFLALAEIPRTPNGKVNRQALPSPTAAEPGETFVAPRDPIESDLVTIWEDVLGRAPVGIASNFFDLGGASLLAVRAFTRMHDRLGVKLPLSVLFQHPTIEHLAHIIRQDRHTSLSSSLVPIQPHGSRPPLFWIHTLGGGGGGGLLRYHKVAHLLGAEQPSYGVREPEEPFHDLAAMAAAYIDTIRSRQPEGPYYLAGYCFGGNVAFEIAQQLHHAGHEVALLALLDCEPPRQALPHGELSVFPGMIRNLPHWLSRFPRQSRGDQYRQLRRFMRYVGSSVWHLRPSPEPKPPVLPLEDVIDLSEYPEDFRDIARVHWHALQTHTPHVYPGCLVLFRTPHEGLVPRSEALGWQHYVAGRVIVEIIPGSHEAFLDDPMVHDVAARLRQHVQQAQAAHASSVSLP